MSKTQGSIEGFAFGAACLALLLALVPVRALAGNASSSQEVSVNVVAGPSPTPTESPPSGSPGPTCIQTRDANDGPQDTFQYKEMIRVFLAAGCANTNEIHIEVDVASTPALLTFVDASAKGGFDTTAQHLPAVVLPGPHEVLVKTIAHTYSAPITVLQSSAGGTGGGSIGTSVLGQTIRRPLPHTGQDIVRLVSLALVLIVAGVGLRRVAQVRRRSRQPAA